MIGKLQAEVKAIHSRLRVDLLACVYPLSLLLALSCCLIVIYPRQIAHVHA